MKKNFMTLFCLCMVAMAFAQNDTYLWAKSMGGTSSDIGYSIAVDASGNVYTTGFFAGTADFDPSANTANLISKGSTDIFVSKLDATGNFVWAKSMGGISIESGYGIAVDASGNVYTTGSFLGTTDFDPSANTANLTAKGSNADIFVSKLDASGNFVWVKSIGETSSDNGLSIAVDASGNVYTTGGFQGTVDFDPSANTANLTSKGIEDIFVSKLDSSGNFVWAKGMGGTSFENGRSIAVDASGNVYTTGYFQGTVDFDPSPNTANLISNGQDIFVSKLDSSGNFVWAKSMGGISNDIGYSIAVDAAGNVYTTGIFGGTADFDPSSNTANLTSKGSFDIFVSKLDASGNFVWAKSIGGTSNDFGYSIAIDALGNVYTTGDFDGTVDFDPSANTANLTSNSSQDIFVSKLDANGNFVWAKSMGGTSSDDGRSIAVDASGNVYTTGEFRGTVDFDPSANTANLISKGGLDIFISKLGLSCTNSTSSSSHTAINSYTWNGTTYTQSGTYTKTGLKNAKGCDSTATLILTINQPSSSSTTQSACSSFTWNDTTYTQSGTYTKTGLKNAKGSDSTATLILTINQPSSSTTTQSACNSFTWIGTTYTQSGTYTKTGLKNAKGCDSTATLNLTINQPSSSTTTQSGCNSFTWNGTSYTQSGTYSKTGLINAKGCDSTATLNLTINQPSSSTTTQSACNSFTWNGTTYTQSGTYTKTGFVNAKSCDSTATLNLTINQPSSSSFNETVTGSYTWNDTTYTQSGTYTKTGLVNAKGCDSTATLNLTINPLTSLIDKGTLEEVKVYPNPAKEVLHVEVFENEIRSVVIKDINGNEVPVSALENENGKARLIIDNVASGMYFLEIHLNNEVIRQKFVK